MWKFSWAERSARGSVCVLVLGLLASCGAGGSAGGSSGGAGGGVGNLSVLAHDPETDEIQVALTAALEISFDGSIDPEALNEDEFTLEEAGSSEPIPGTFTTKQGGKTVVFQPRSDLKPATDYTLTLQPTLCDTAFRTLDQEFSFSFRSYDDIAPVVRSSSVIDNQTEVARGEPFLVRISERVAAGSVHPNTVTLHDIWGTAFPLDLHVAGDTVQIAPVRDLPGSRRFALTIRGGTGGLTDVAGNELAASWSVHFQTAEDREPPELVSSDPPDRGTGVSPLARLTFRFSESMDLGSYEPTGLVLEDAFLNPMPVGVDQSRDGKSLFLQPQSPLIPDETYTVRFRPGPLGMTDVSGNSLASEVAATFHVGDDQEPPTIVSTQPGADETRISPNVAIEIRFTEPVKRESITARTVTFSGGGGSPGADFDLAPDAMLLRVVPTTLLAPATEYRLTLRRGYDGVQDLAGNPLRDDYELRFTTSGSTALPTFITSPPHGASLVPVTSRITAVASEVVDPATVNASTFKVKTAAGDTISGSLSVARGNRAIVFRPLHPLPGTESIRVTLKGGYEGIRLGSGNWADRDTVTAFRVGTQVDILRPQLRLTLNRIHSSRNQDLAVPPWGFTIDVSAFDSGNLFVDPTTLVLTLQGPGSVPSPDELFQLGRFTATDASIRIDGANALPVGDYRLTALIKDTSDNESLPQEIDFSVTSAFPSLRPFERTQIVWVQFDSDREGNGRGDGFADFDQDLWNMGLIATGDPIGRNAWLRRLVSDGVLRLANDLFERTATSSRREGSVNLRLVTRQPCRATHMKIAVGGADPSGAPNRKYGDDSTGVLGRALFDYRNEDPNENNAGTTPGLGVFVGELFLYQARLYLDLYPHFITRFGRTFRGLSPHMGGKPAGTHSLDAVVLAEKFDYASATADQKARYDEIMTAADDLASAIGVVLAHEIGHSVGLVAQGPPSSGLHGDQSLHNATTGITDVMGPVLGYESVISLDFQFRPLNLAYLRERILLK